MSTPGHMRTTTSTAQTKRDIGDTFRKWGVRDYDIRLGLRDAEVLWTINDRPQRFTCSRFADAGINLRAIYLALDATRLAAQRGILEELAAVAVAMLPAGRIKRPPHEVLGIAPGADIDIAEAAYRVKAKRAHPDHGGSDRDMQELNEALEEFKRAASC